MEKIDSGVVRFGSDLMVLCDWVDPTNLVVVGGRGVAKSTVVIARRSNRCVRLMPGAPLAIVADTYTNLINNIMPAVQNGWRLLGLIEGVHYIKGRRPPLEWSARCSVIVDDYKNVYSFWNGSVLFLGSLDSPSLLAGKSVAHLFFDEAKYASDAKAARVMPILRGDAISYGRCHLYGGVTVTTDMPDVTEGEYDWFFRYADEMDPDRVIKAMQVCGELNKLRKKLVAANQSVPPDAGKIARLERKIAYYEDGLLKIRKGLTFFTNISSFANIDVLTVDYARRLYDGALERHEFFKSVLGMRPSLRQDARFYVLFSEKLKYRDGTLSGEPAFSSEELVHLNPRKPIEGGMDFGNMLSLVIGQPDGRSYRVHKCLYVLPKAWMRELADAFISFFSSHEEKTLYLYYDRSGNNYEQQGQDYARQIKEAIEYDVTGNPTGWTVVLMSRGQSNLLQWKEFNFMIEFMKGDNKDLPRLLVDEQNCSEMVSSIERAKATVKYKGDKKIVVKVKKSEKLVLKKLPRLSTNFSDAFKYLMMRKEWMNIIDGRRTSGSGAARVADEWFNEFFSKLS